jgi:phage-related protein
MYSINFKGLDSYEDFGLLLKKAPEIPKATENIEVIDIPGRGEKITRRDGTYSAVKINLEFTIDNPDLSIEDLNGWLYGEGELILTYLEGFYCKVIDIDTYNIDSLYIKKGAEFPVTFTCQPFRYSENLFRKSSAPFSIIYNGTKEGDLILKVFGSGKITINVNNENIIINNINEYVTIDGELLDCYKDYTLCNNDVLTNFPQLHKGTNQISWDGNVTSIEASYSEKYR